MTEYRDLADALMEDLRALGDVSMPEESSELYDPLDDKRIYVRDPDMVEMRVPEFKHTTYPCLLVTMDLGLDINAPILEDFKKGGGIVEGMIYKYFYEIYTPNAQDEELFLPAKYQPYDAVEKAYNLDNGKQPDTELGKYIAERTSPLIILIDSLYKNFSSRAWFCKFWMIAEHNKFAFLKGGIER